MMSSWVRWWKIYSYDSINNRDINQKNEKELELSYYKIEINEILAW